MIDALLLLLSGLAGMAIAAIFFGGLWWTVRHAMRSDRAWLWQIASLLARMAFAVTAFHWVGQGDAERLLSCLAGFLLGRVLILRLTQPDQQGRTGAAEVGHAPQP